LADATYKTNDEGYPSLTCGTTDKTKKFHPFGIGVSFNERAEDFKFMFQTIKCTAEKVTSKEYTPNTLVADSADAITRGFIDVFMRLVYRINCSVHVIRNIDDYLRPIEEPERNQIRCQILQIQASTTKTIFEAAKLLFLNQHRKSPNEGIKNLCKYLAENWFAAHKNGWYEGYLVGVPSHSNAIESFHLHGIKRKKNIITRLPSLKHLKTLETVVQNWSLDRAELLYCTEREQMIPNPNVRLYLHEPVYTEKYLLDSYNYTKINKSIIKLKIENDYVYFIPSGDETELSKEQCRDYVSKMERCQFKNFSELFSVADSINMVKLNLNSWRKSQCSCHIWQKNYNCFHVPFVASKEPKCDFTFKEIILQMPLQQKKKEEEKKKLNQLYSISHKAAWHQKILKLVRMKLMRMRTKPKSKLNHLKEVEKRNNKMFL
jgi:hypothetical protein